MDSGKNDTIMIPTKLELTWIGKENRPKVEPRILIEDAAKSYHAAFRAGDNDIFDNRLIFGDNLLALKALEQEFAGQVKCIYIDPPYNTGNAFEQYDDGIEHSIWLSLMRERFEFLKNLLSMDGVIFCQLNDDEMAYGKVILDEVFGKHNGKPWIYLLIPHDAIADNKTLKGFSATYQWPSQK